MSDIGCLYIVATPIGNLGDITLRAIETLTTVDMIAAEDTRHSRRLLTHLDIHTPMLSLHEHNEKQRVQKIISLLQAGKCIALISDAGTPLISDPGYPLVRAVREAGIQVVPVPGACAAIAALSAAGLATDRFVFEGFLPAKGGARLRHLQALVNELRTIVLYESKHRILALFESLVKVFGEQREALIARELTKSFETLRLGTLAELSQWLQDDLNQQKGEFVVLVAGADESSQHSDEVEVERVLTILLAELPLKQAVSLATKILDINRKPLYTKALALNKNRE